MFAEGWAQYLAAHAAGLLWKPTGAYAPTEVGIGLTGFPASIDLAVALTPYVLSRDATFGEDEIGLQVMTRSKPNDPRGMWALDDKISNALLGLWSFTLPGGLTITQVTPGPSGSMGRDDNQRWLWSSNYVCLVSRPTINRI